MGTKHGKSVTRYVMKTTARSHANNPPQISQNSRQFYPRLVCGGLFQDAADGAVGGDEDGDGGEEDAGDEGVGDEGDFRGDFG